MEDNVSYLVDKAWDLYTPLEPSRRLLLAIAGIPGSGKTTLAALVANKLNARYRNSTSSQSDEVALVIPLDGYHLTRKQLSLMPNSEEAHFRRGAAFTFDGENYLKLVEALREPLSTSSETPSKTIHAPSFDHAIKDPVADDIPIPPSARILIFEGLYVALSRPPWSEAASLMDEIWFVDVPLPVAEARVAKRNFAAGVSPTLEAALDRTKKNDMRNADDVLENRVGSRLIRETVGSIEDDEWKSEGLKRVEKDMEEERQRQNKETEGAHGDRPPTVGERGRMDSIALLVADGAGM